MAFSTVSAKRPKNILPAIKMSNRAVLRDVLLNEEEVSLFNQSLDLAGPTPGVVPLAAARKRLAPAFSFNKVAMKSALGTKNPKTIDRGTYNSSVDFGKPALTIEESDSHLVAIGKYNKNKRYGQPMLAPLVAEPSVQILGEVNPIRGPYRYEKFRSARHRSPHSPSAALLGELPGANSLLHIHQPKLAAGMVSQSLNVESGFKQVAPKNLMSATFMRSEISEVWKP